jgi:5-methylcytosine-specific restriction endonuclease McrA
MDTKSRIIKFLPYNDIASRIGTGNPLIINTQEGDIHVKQGTNRLICLVNNPNCVCCGARGQFFLLEENSEHNGGHINLYAEDENYELLLLTIDHIVPKSHGGSNDLSNLQTMCSVCNNHKANMHLSLEELRDYISAINKIKFYNRKK